MIVVTVFLSILNQMDFHLVQNRKESSLSVGYCATDHCINRAHGWMLTVQFHMNIYLPTVLLKLGTYFWEVMSKTNY